MLRSMQLSFAVETCIFELRSKGGAVSHSTLYETDFT